jgi:hypothetical protein
MSTWLVVCDCSGRVISRDRKRVSYPLRAHVNAKSLFSIWTIGTTKINITDTKGRDIVHRPSL